MTASRVARLLAVSALTALSQLGTPVGACGFAAADRRQVAAPTGVAGATAADRATRGLHGTIAADPEATGTPAQLADLDLPRVWQLTRGAGQRVAVIDTGVSRHRRLPDVVPGGDYVFTGDGTQDCDAHGTLVAGIIAAAPDSRADDFSGVAPEATVISIRQSSAKFAPAGDRSSTGVGDVDTMAKAVRTAADLGASVINISSVACVPAASALDDRALGAALAYAVDVKNAVVVAAAGNTGGAGAVSASAAGRNLGHRHGRGQSGLVRRLRADRRFGERRGDAVGIHPGRALGGCRRHRRGGDARSVRRRCPAPAMPRRSSAGWPR